MPTRGHSLVGARRPRSGLGPQAWRCRRRTLRGPDVGGVGSRLHTGPLCSCPRAWRHALFGYSSGFKDCAAQRAVRARVALQRFAQAQPPRGSRPDDLCCVDVGVVAVSAPGALEVLGVAAARVDVAALHTGPARVCGDDLDEQASGRFDRRGDGALREAPQRISDLAVQRTLGLDAWPPACPGAGAHCA